VTRLFAAEPLVRWDWVQDHADDIWEALVEHIRLTVVAVGIGFAISMTLAIASLRWRWLYGPIAGICGALYAVPSVALFAVLLPIMGFGFWLSAVALITYTLLILLRNIVTAVDGVPDDVKEAADGMGYEPWRRFLAVDLRIATPTIVAGLRIATVTTIGLVTVTALVGAGGLGDLINDGLSRRGFPTPIVVGTVLSVALAVALDVIFVVAERLLAPWSAKGSVARG
jgi:osmoprotectant transport system permease protein